MNFCKKRLFYPFYKKKKYAILKKSDKLNRALYAEFCKIGKGCMKMAVKGLAHTALNVSDMEKSIAFYCDVLGFRKAFEMNHPETGKPWIVYLYAGGDQFLELFYGGVDYREYQDTNIGFSHFCLEVQDIQQIAKQITDAGWELDRPVKFGIDGNWQCWVRDPDRNRVELMQIGEESPQKKFLQSMGR